MRRMRRWTRVLVGLSACNSWFPIVEDPSWTDADASTTAVGASTTSPTGGGTGTTSAGTTGTSAGAGETATTAVEATFLVPPDAPPGPCDPWAQDCPEGQKCNWWADDGGSSWNATKCVPVVENPKQLGEACLAPDGGTGGVDDCDLGLMCWNVDPEDEGVCIELCKGPLEEQGICEGAGTTCKVSGEGFGLCLGCDPLAQDCYEGAVCVGNRDNGFVCVTDNSGAEGQAHDPCLFPSDCDPGLMCNDPSAGVECDQDAEGCCEPFCDLSDPNADMNCGGAGQVCNPWFAEGTAPVDYETVGYCAVPT